jgi:aquaporin Z
MNPARSIAPALVAFELESLWLYVAAPCCGALAAVGICRAVRDGGCCAWSGGCAGSAR